MTQRRSTKLLHISPKLSISRSIDDDEKPPRSSSRTNRIWLILVLLLSTLFLLHKFFPSPSQPRLPSYASGDLNPKNYFNASSLASGSPFPFCPSSGPSDVLAAKYTPGVLSQTRTFTGTGYRTQRLLKRALSGQPVTISIIGGSISACHGAGNDPISPECYPSKFFDWWNTIFPHPATEITNGAMRRTNSDYFGYCSAHHLPDVTDLVIVELDSDDTRDEQNTQSFEFLIRSLLSRPDSPAVLILGHFSPQVHQAYGFNGPEQWHNAVALYYDVPHISTRPILYQSYITDSNNLQSTYYADPMLANEKGHTLLSDVLVAYFQSVVCQVWDDVVGGGDGLYDSSLGRGGRKKKGGSGLFGGIGLRKGVPEPDTDIDPTDVDPEADRNPAPGTGEDNTGTTSDKSRNALSDSVAHFKLPPGLMSLPSLSTPRTQDPPPPFTELAPYCVSANDLINPLPPSLFYGSGWQSYHPSTSAQSSHMAKHDTPGGATAEHYFYSTLPLSRIRIPMVVSHGDVGVYYLMEGKEKLIGTGGGGIWGGGGRSGDGEGSQVECWVDDNYRGRKRLSNLLEEDAGGVKVTLTLIDHFVAKGSHFVECQLLGEEGQGVPMFKIVGVFAN